MGGGGGAVPGDGPPQGALRWRWCPSHRRRQGGSLPIHVAADTGHLATVQFLAALEPSTLFVKGWVRLAVCEMTRRVTVCQDETPLERAHGYHRHEVVAFLEAAMVCLAVWCDPSSHLHGSMR